MASADKFKNRYPMRRKFEIVESAGAPVCVQGASEEPDILDALTADLNHTKKCLQFRLEHPDLFRSGEEDCPDANCPWAK